MTYTDLKQAIAILGLEERATLQEIKARHRELVKLHHPDAGGASDPETIRNINAAYRVVLDYLNEYRFSFTEEEFYQQNEEERFRRQFMEFYN